MPLNTKTIATDCHAWEVCKLTCHRIMWQSPPNSLYTANDTHQNLTKYLGIAKVMLLLAEFRQMSFLMAHFDFGIFGLVGAGFKEGVSMVIGEFNSRTLR